METNQHTPICILCRAADPDRRHLEEFQEWKIYSDLLRFELKSTPSTDTSDGVCKKLGNHLWREIQPRTVANKMKYLKTTEIFIGWANFNVFKRFFKHSGSENYHPLRFWPTINSSAWRPVQIYNLKLNKKLSVFMFLKSMTCSMSRKQNLREEQIFQLQWSNLCQRQEYASIKASLHVWRWHMGRGYSSCIGSSTASELTDRDT